MEDQDKPIQIYSEIKRVEEDAKAKTLMEELQAQNGELVTTYGHVLGMIVANQRYIRRVTSLHMAITLGLGDQVGLYRAFEVSGVAANAADWIMPISEALNWMPRLVVEDWANASYALRRLGITLVTQQNLERLHPQKALSSTEILALTRGGQFCVEIKNCLLAK